MMPIVFPWYRLGYIIPHRHTDMDGYQFARVAPDGMLLVTTQLDLAEYSLEGGGARVARAVAGRRHPELACRLDLDLGGAACGVTRPAANDVAAGRGH